MYTSIYGHKTIKDKFSGLISKDCMEGAYLLCGPLCVGKRTLAFETSRYLLCKKDSEDICSCDSCKRFPYNHPDFICIGHKERVKVETIDNVISFVSVAPFLSSKKVVVIDNAETMTWSAANRLLKILEEPPEGFVFFVVSSDPDKIIETVRSRCIRFDFGTLSQENTINVFYKKLGFDLPKARVLGWIASGSSADIFSNAGVYLKHRNNALDFANGLKKKDLIDSLDFIDKIGWKDLPVFVDMLILVLTDILLLKNDISSIINADVREYLEKISKGFNDKAIVSATNTLSQTKKNKHLNVNMNLALKNMLIKSYPLFSS